MATKWLKVLGAEGVGFCAGGGRDVYSGEVVEIDDVTANIAIQNGSARLATEKEIEAATRKPKPATT